MKILVIRLSSIGDIVLTTPVVRCLKKQLQAEVHYLTKKNYYSILSHNPYVDRVHVYGEDTANLMRKLKQENYDLVIDLHHNLRTFLIKAQLRKKSYSFRKYNIEKWLYVNFKVDRLPNVHIVDRYLDTCKRMGVLNDFEGLDYFIPEKDELEISSLPDGFQNGYIAWVVGAQGFTKQYPTEKIINVLNHTKMPVILIGGKEDKQKGKSIMKYLEHRELVYNATGVYHLNQSASLIRQATVVVTNDTGLMHIAAAFRKKIISIWGSTVLEFGMYPYFGHHRVQNIVIEEPELSCRPCSKLGRSACPKGHFQCMKLIPETRLTRDMESLFAAP